MGPATETIVELNGVSVQSLIDTGSQISTISKCFYDEYLSNVEIRSLNEILQVEGANGSRVPYFGYVEVQLKVPDCLIDCSYIPALFLIVPNTSYNSKTPVLLGTNVLYTCSQLQEAGKFQPTSGIWQRAFNVSRIQMQTRVLGMPVYTQKSVKIPATSRVMVQGFCGALSSRYLGNKSVVIEADGNLNLPSGLLVTPVWISGKDLTCHLQVEVNNISQRDVELAAHTAFCDVYPVDVESYGTSENSKRMVHQFQQTVNEDRVAIPDEDFLKMFELSHLTLEQQEQMKRLLLKWKCVFSLHDQDLGLVKGYEHHIHLTDPTPFKDRFPHIPPHMVEEVREHLKNMEKTGVIQPSHSQYSSPLVLVRKSDNSLRFCVDFRKLNKRTLSDCYSMPSVESTLNRLAGAKYFSSMDLKTGYWQIPLAPEDRHKCAFSAGVLGFWEYLRLPMGISNACSSFQRMIESVMDTLNLDACLLYLDDIIVASASYEEHLDKLEKVLQRLWERGLKLKPSKCSFLQEEIKYLGCLVSSDGVKADPKKIESVRQWPVPQSYIQLRRFLGFSGYFRKFIKDYAVIAKCLHELLKGALEKKGKICKKIPFVWEDCHQRAFDKLITVLTSTPVLAFADFTKPFEVETDASTSGLGAVLFQVQDGVRRVIAFASRSLNSAESKYPAHKLECLAMKWAICEKFRDYLYGAPSFILTTDNNPLTYIMTTAKLDAMTHRWVAELSQFNFEIRYRRGVENKAADALSRMSETTVKAIWDGTRVEDLVSSCSMSHQVVPEEVEGNTPVGGMSNLEWSELQQKDPDIKSMLEYVNSGQKRRPSSTESLGFMLLWKERFKLFVQDGVLFRKRMINGKEEQQIVLPPEHRRYVFQLLHEDMGHMGQERTLDLIRSRFFWPKMQKEIEGWVRTCDRCLRRNKVGHVHRAELHPIISKRPLEVVCMDFLSVETSVGGYDSILVLTDHYTRYAMAVPTRNQTALTTAKALVNLFVLHYGLPERLHSDQGPNFESKVIKELCQLLNIKRSHTTPYHAAGNGMCERMNRTLLSMLATLPPEKKSRWKEYVAPMIHAYNCTRHDSTGFAPFELMFGRKPRLPIDVVLGLNHAGEQKSYPEYVQQLKTRLKEAYTKASENIKKAIGKMSQQYNKKMRGPTLEVGDKVLVRKVTFEGKHKLDNYWEEDVYLIVKKHANLPVYDVRKETGSGRIRRLHRNLLLPLPEGGEDSGEKDNESSESSHEYISSSDSEEEVIGRKTRSQVTKEKRTSDLENQDDGLPQIATVDEEIPVADPTTAVQSEAKAESRELRPQEDSEDSDLDKPIAVRKGKRNTRKPAYLTSGEFVTNMQNKVVEPSTKEKMDLLNKMLDLLS